MDHHPGFLLASHTILEKSFIELMALENIGVAIGIAFHRYHGSRDTLGGISPTPLAILRWWKTLSRPRIINKNTSTMIGQVVPKPVRYNPKCAIMRQHVQQHGTSDLQCRCLCYRSARKPMLILFFWFAAILNQLHHFHFHDTWVILNHFSNILLLCSVSSRRLRRGVSPKNPADNNVVFRV